MAHVVGRDGGSTGKIVIPFRLKIRMLATVGAFLVLAGSAVAQISFQLPGLNVQVPLSQGNRLRCRPFTVYTPDGPRRQKYCLASDGQWYPRNAFFQQAGSPPPTYSSQQPTQSRDYYDSNGASSSARTYAAAPPRQSPAALSQQQIADLSNDIASPLHAWIGISPEKAIDGHNFFEASGVDIARIRRGAQKVLKGKIVFTPVRQSSAVTMEQYGADNHRKWIHNYLLPFCASRQPTCRAPYRDIDGAIEVSNTEGNAPKIYVWIYDENQSPHGAFCMLQNGGLSCVSPGGNYDTKMYLTDDNTEGLNDSVRDGYLNSQGGLMGALVGAAARDFGSAASNGNNPAGRQTWCANQNAGGNTMSGC
jgi:hypothetical protein